MLQELTAQSGAGLWATGSLLFFIVVYVFVSVRLYCAPAEELDAHARLALDDGDAAGNADRGRQS